MSSDNPTHKNPVVGPRLEELLLNSDSDSDFDPRAFESDPPAARARHFPSPAAHAQAEQAASTPPPLLAPPPKASRRQITPQQQQQHPQPNKSHPLPISDAFGYTPFTAPTQVAASPNLSTSPFSPQNASTKPNYNIGEFDRQTTVFNTTSFTNGLSGYHQFEQKEGNNIFANGYGNSFNGFGNLSEKQTVELNSSFNGFLNQTITEMKDGFSRGITFGNDDFSIDNFDPLKKN